MIDQFTDDYIECAFWCGVAEEDNEDLGNELAPETLEEMKAECARFQEENSNLLRAYTYHHEQYAGHDFWLTRNGHGTGFWDRDAGFIGKVLSKRAEAYGPAFLYVGDDGLVYLEEG